MISTIELEKRVTGAGIFGVSVSKLRHKKKSYSIILFKIDEGQKVGFYCAILPLNLAVCLRVEDGREFLLDT